MRGYAGIIQAVVRVGKVIRFRMEDVLAALEEVTKQTAPSAGSEDIARFVMWLLAPDVADMPTWMIEREPTPEEEAQAAKRAAPHWPVVATRS